jgi:hypothetical protein
LDEEILVAFEDEGYKIAVSPFLASDEVFAPMSS